MTERICVNRSTFRAPVQDKPSTSGLPADPTFIFGSAHGSGLHVGLADGSVRNVRYSVTLAIWQAYGNRTDATVGNLD